MSSGSEWAMMVWTLVCTVLVFVMQVGFCCLETGLARNKHSINIAIKNLADFCIAAVVFWAFGYGLMFGPTAGGIVGLGGLFVDETIGSAGLKFFIFQMMFCGTAATIISGAVAERMRFMGYLAVSLVVSTFIYPVVGHWVWSGVANGAPTGWLGRLGFLDFAGSTVVHSVGGWTALAAAVVIGPRAGRFSADWPHHSGSNVPMAIVGALLLWVGWFGFNGGSEFQSLDAIPLILVNTVMAGSVGALAALGAAWWLRGYPDPIEMMNGALAGMVAITASANLTTPGRAVVIGAVAGLLCVWATRFLEKRRVDDVVGAIPVHGFVGVWGTLAVALFGNAEKVGAGLDRLSQLGVQALGSLAVFAWAFGGSLLILRVVNRVIPLRASAEAEAQGLDLIEHRRSNEILDTVRGLREREDRYAKAVHATNEGLWDWNFVTGAVQYSRRWSDILGFDEAEIGTAPNAWFDRVHPDDRDRLMLDVEEHLARADAHFQSQHRMQHRDGTFRWVEVRAMTMRDERGVPLRLVGTLADITARKEAEAVLRDQAVQDALASSQEQERMREMFVGILGHDLRNPLSGIIMCAQLMLARNQDETLSEPLLRVLSNSQRMARMVEQLLDLTRLRLGDGIALAPRPSDLRRLLDEVVAENDDNRSRCQLVAVGETAGTWDPDRILQVISNLVGNAVRHSAEGSPVLVKLDGTDQGRVVLTVHNVGPPIPEDLRPVLFAAFRGQAHGRRSGGLGLGLYITDQLVRAHGGNVSFESSADSGTTFTVTLPRHAQGERPR